MRLQVQADDAISIFDDLRIKLLTEQSAYRDIYRSRNPVEIKIHDVFCRVWIRGRNMFPRPFFSGKAFGLDGRPGRWPARSVRAALD